MDLTQGVDTPMYMSREMLRHSGYDERTDVWSFGELLWEIAAQAPPDLLGRRVGWWAEKLRGKSDRKT